MAVRKTSRMPIIVVSALLTILFGVLLAFIYIKWHQMPSVSKDDASSDGVVLAFTLNGGENFLGVPATAFPAQTGSVVLVKADGSAQALKVDETEGATPLWSDSGIFVPTKQEELCITPQGVNHLLSSNARGEILRRGLNRDRFIACYKSVKRDKASRQCLVVGDSTKAKMIEAPGYYENWGVSNDALYACTELYALNPDMRQAAFEYCAPTYETTQYGQRLLKFPDADVLMQLYSGQSETPQVLAVAPRDHQLTHTCDLFVRQGNTVTTLAFKYSDDDITYPRQGTPVLVHWNLETQERSYQPLMLFTGEPRLWTTDDFLIEASRLEGNTCTVVLRGGMVMSIDITTGDSEVLGMIPAPQSDSFGTAYLIQDNFIYMLTVQDPVACITSADLTRFSLKDGGMQHLLTVEGITYGCSGSGLPIRIPGFALNPEWVKSLDS